MIVAGLNRLNANQNPKLKQWVWAFMLLGVAYAVMNERLLVESILYRVAAADQNSAITAAFGYALHGMAFACAMIFLPRRWFVAALILVGASALVNIGYGRIVGDAVDQPKIAWMLTEAGQAGNAAGAFAGPAIIAIVSTLVALSLIVFARHMLNIERGRLALLIGLAGLIVPILFFDHLRLAPVPAERNGWVFLIRTLTAPPPPNRAEVATRPGQPVVENIIWLVDESVNYAAYVREIKPSTLSHRPVDFGEAMSLGNCSTPSNVALRSGVNVRKANDKIDLRATPSIWNYALKAGFQTTLIDGQMTGPTQNLILDPERKLIKFYFPAKQGVDTDRKIAAQINAIMRKGGRNFIYVVLSGAHFQYRDHYPQNYIPENSPIEAQYAAAVRYSKLDFFDRLLANTDREKLVVFYTSDHGQNVQGAQVPHCNPNPHRQEFSVPLLGFLPQSLTMVYQNIPQGGRSHGQIFATSLKLMGYEDHVGSQYDNDLLFPSARKLWFGRNVVPVEPGASIEIHDKPPF